MESQATSRVIFNADEKIFNGSFEASMEDWCDAGFPEVGAAIECNSDEVADNCSNGGSSTSFDSNSEVGLSEFFRYEKAYEPLLKLLDAELYSNYPYSGPFSGMKKLLGCYRDYLKMLEIIDTIPRITEDLSVRLGGYLNKFQDVINSFAYTVEDISFSAEDKLDVIESLLIPMPNQDIQLSYMMSELEYSLHALTEQQLLCTAEQCLKYIERIAGKQNNFDQETQYELTEIITHFTQVIHNWKGFIQGLSDFLQEKEVNFQSRTECLLQWCTNSEIAYVESIIEGLQEWVTELISCNKALLNEGHDLPPLHRNIAHYKKVFQGIECLAFIGNMKYAHKKLSTACTAFFHGMGELFLDFFPEIANRLLEDFQKIYVEIINKKHCQSKMQYFLFHLYKMLKNLHFIWGDFITSYDFSDANERCVAQVKYEKWQTAFQTSGIMSSEFLQFLFTLLQSLHKGLNLYPLFYENVHKELEILQTITQLIRQLSICTEGCIDQNDSTYSEYQKGCEIIEMQLKEMCLKFQHIRANATHLSRKTTARSLRVQMGIEAYWHSFSQFDWNSYYEIIALCEHYFGETWFSSEHEDNAGPVSAYMPRIR